jgi:hypothetical protein
VEGVGSPEWQHEKKSIWLRKFVQWRTRENGSLHKQDPLWLYPIYFDASPHYSTNHEQLKLFVNVFHLTQMDEFYMDNNETYHRGYLRSIVVQFAQGMLRSGFTNQFYTRAKVEQHFQNNTDLNIMDYIVLHRNITDDVNGIMKLNEYKINPQTSINSEFSDSFYTHMLYRRPLEGIHQNCSSSLRSNC